MFVERRISSFKKEMLVFAAEGRRSSAVKYPEQMRVNTEHSEQSQRILTDKAGPTSLLSLFRSALSGLQQNLPIKTLPAASLA